MHCAQKTPKKSYLALIGILTGHKSINRKELYQCAVLSAPGPPHASIGAVSDLLDDVIPARAQSLSCRNKSEVLMSCLQAISCSCRWHCFCHTK